MMNEFDPSSITSAYIHLPFCIQRCLYCDFPISVVGDRTSMGTRQRMEEYVAYLCREIRAAAMYGKGEKLETIFFGGGTPSLLPTDLLEQILCVIREKFGVCDQAELSLEIDPGTFSLEQLIWYKETGINRVSLGVQAFQPCLLQNSGRSHAVIDIESACDHLQQCAINWSLDLISGLPDQTLAHWQESLGRAIALHPDHISSYDLVVEPQTAFGKQYQPGEKPLPSDEQTAEMYRMASRMLREAGYDHYEVSNYAKPGHQCRHNRVYWENRSYYAFGMGAASYTNHQRFSRPRRRSDYFEWVEQYERDQGTLPNVEVLDQGDRLLETLMLGLRLTEGISFSRLTAEFGQDTLKQVLEILQPYINRNWVILPTNAETDQQYIALTDPEGLLFSNTILSTLFRDLE